MNDSYACFREKERQDREAEGWEESPAAPHRAQSRGQGSTAPPGPRHLRRNQESNTQPTGPPRCPLLYFRPPGPHSKNYVLGTMGFVAPVPAAQLRGGPAAWLSELPPAPQESRSLSGSVPTPSHLGTCKTTPMAAKSAIRPLMALEASHRPPRAAQLSSRETERETSTTNRASPPRERTPRLERRRRYTWGSRPGTPVCPPERRGSRRQSQPRAHRGRPSTRPAGDTQFPGEVTEAAAGEAEGQGHPRPLASAGNTDAQRDQGPGRSPAHRSRVPHRPLWRRHPRLKAITGGRRPEQRKPSACGGASALGSSAARRQVDKGQRSHHQRHVGRLPCADQGGGSQKEDKGSVCSPVQPGWAGGGGDGDGTGQLQKPPSLPVPYCTGDSRTPRAGATWKATMITKPPRGAQFLPEPRMRPSRAGEQAPGPVQRVTGSERQH